MALDSSLGSPQRKQPCAQRLFEYKKIDSRTGPVQTIQCLRLIDRADAGILQRAFRRASPGRGARPADTICGAHARLAGSLIRRYSFKPTTRRARWAWTGTPFRRSEGCERATKTTCVNSTRPGRLLF